MKVLVIDDERSWPNYYRDNVVATEVEILHAWNIAQGQVLFEQYSDEIEMIIIDGMMQAPIEVNCKFIRAARWSGYTKPMVAASDNYRHNNAMIEAGCDFAVRSKIIDKEQLNEIAPHLARSSA